MGQLRGDGRRDQPPLAGHEVGIVEADDLDASMPGGRETCRPRSTARSWSSSSRARAFGLARMRIAQRAGEDVGIADGASFEPVIPSNSIPKFDGDTASEFEAQLPGSVSLSTFDDVLHVVMPRATRRCCARSLGPIVAARACCSCRQDRSVAAPHTRTRIMRVHDRMPEILATDAARRWIKPGPLPAGVLVPYPAEEMQAWRSATPRRTAGSSRMRGWRSRWRPPDLGGDGNVRLPLPFQHTSTDVRGGDYAGPFTRRAAGHRRSAVHGEPDHSAWSAQRKTTSGKGDGRHPGAEGARRRLRASNDLAGPCPHGVWRRASVGGSGYLKFELTAMRSAPA